MDSEKYDWNYIELAQKLVMEADQHHEAGQLDAAMEKCNKALETDPGAADAYNLRGIILEDMGRYREAARDYKQAIDYDPDFTEAQQNLQALEITIQEKFGEQQNTMVTVATYNSEAEAYLDKAKLESSGIPAFLISMSWISSIALGGVELQVEDSNVHMAWRILNSEVDITHNDNPTIKLYDYYCTNCGKNVDEEWEKCPHCDNSLQATISEELSYEFICTRCKNTVSDKWNYCPNCNEKLIEVSNYCSLCDCEIEGEWKHCPKCGELLD